MKVYCFYLVDNEISCSEYRGVIADTVGMLNGKDYTLYAFTQNKEFAKFFKDTRDMNKFIYKEIEIDDFDEFLDNYDSYLIEYHSVRTKTIESGKEMISSIEFPMTKIESDFILFYSDNYFVDLVDSGISYNSEVLSMLKYKLFKKSITKALDTINFYGVFTDIITPSDIPYDGMFCIDQWSMYFKVFGNTLKKG